MIPAFEKEGYLPAGIHLATLDEVETRFSYTIWRKKLFTHLLKLIADLKTIGCTAIYLDGSFTTTRRIPSDMDICWEDEGIDSDIAEILMPILFEENKYRKERQQRKYMADIFPANIIEGGSGVPFLEFFQKDKATGKPKGIVKIIIN
jgi:hypothetical protein